MLNNIILTLSYMDMVEFELLYNYFIALKV